jgi:PAS domain S-box-containing protein
MMRLRNLFLIIVILFVVTGVGSVYFSARYGVLNEFKRIEETQLITNVQRVQAQIQEEVVRLETIITDWAYWDDTYQFVIEPSEAYIQSNLVLDTFLELNLNYIAFYDLDGNLVFDRWVDLAIEEEIPTPLWQADWIKENDLIIRDAKEWHETAGIIHTPAGDMILSTRAILPSLEENDPRGTLIFAHFLDETLLNKLKRVSNVDFLIFENHNQPYLFSEEESLSLKKNNTVIQYSQDSESTNTIGTMTAFQTIQNIRGEPDYLLVVEHPREIYQIGLSSFDRFSVFLLIVGSVLAFVFINILYFYLLRRLERMSLIVQKISSTQNLSIRLPVKHKDEITDLSHAINQMIFSLDEAQKNALRYERRFRNILENMNLITIILDPQGRLEYCNQYLLDLTGYSQDEILYKDWFSVFVPGEESEMIRGKVAQHVEGLKNYVHGENYILTKSGDKRLISWSNTPIADNDGNPIGVASIGEDITLKHLAAEEIRRSEAMLKSIMDAAPIVIGLVKDEQMVWLSDKIEGLTGYSLPELIGRPPSIFYDSSNFDAYREIMINISHDIKNQSNSFLRTQWIKKDKQVIDVDLRVAALTPYSWEDGVIVTAMDLTEQLKSEENLNASFEQIKTLLTRMSALRNIDQAITSPDESGELIKQILGLMRQTLNLDVVMVSLFEKGHQYLRLIGINGKEVEADCVGITFTENAYIRQARETNELVSQLRTKNSDFQDLRYRLNTELELEQYMVVPLMVKGEVLGVLEVLAEKSVCHGPDCREFLQTMAVQLAIALDNANLANQKELAFEALQNSYEATIEGWALALEMRDKETAGHSERVVELTIELAKRVGFSDEECTHLRRGVRLHDIGKMSIPDRVLLKPGSLNEEEWEIMKQHPVYAYNLLKEIPYLLPALDIPYCHHERWNGSGYPRGLMGEEIPLGARIFAVVDIWDALTSDRPYRAAWSTQKTVAYLNEQAGILVDPQLVDLFLQVLVEKKEIPIELIL